MRAVVLCCALTGCVASTRRSAGDFVANLDASTTDGVLIDWHSCEQPRPCIAGEWQDAAYLLAFHGSPGLVTGTYLGRPLELRLDTDSVARLGDHAIEMTFHDDTHGAVLALTWNELDQRPISSELVFRD